MRILRLEASSVIIGLKRIAVDVKQRALYVLDLELLEVDLELNIAPSAEGNSRIDLELKRHYLPTAQGL